MHDVVFFIAYLVWKNPFAAYFCMYLATIFFGNIATFLSTWIVFAAHLGVAGILALAGTVFFAEITCDLLWYSIGQLLRGTNFGLWVENRLPGHHRAESALQEKGRRWLFLSKFMFGFSAPITFSIGWSNMEFKNFFKNSLLSTIVWLPVFMGLAIGIVSGLAPLAMNFRRIEWILLIGLLLFLLIEYAIGSGIKLISESIDRRSKNDLS